MNDKNRFRFARASVLGLIPVTVACAAFAAYAIGTLVYGLWRGDGETIFCGGAVSVGAIIIVAVMIAGLRRSRHDARIAKAQRRKQ